MKVVLILTILIGLEVANGQWADDLSGVLTTGVSEGTAIGTTIGTLKYNINQGDVVVFSTTSEYLEVQPNTGLVSLKRQLVYLQNKTLVVEFAAKVNNRAEELKIVTMRVLPINHAPFFDATSYRTSISSNSVVGSLVFNSILVTDTDEGINGTVNVECDRNSSPDTCDYFAVTFVKEQNTTYRVTVNLARVIDSNRQSYNLSMKATDQGGLSGSAILQVLLENLVDSRPIILDTPIIFALDEFSALNVNVTTLRIRDGRTSAVGNSLSFDITDDVRSWFRLGTPTISADGTYNVPIFVARNISIMDNNMIPRYTFTVNARQLFNGQANAVYSATQVTVNIRDINNNAPTFGQTTYNATLSEGLTNGATIAGLSITVFDNDLGDNAYFELTVVSNPSPSTGIFGIVPTSGQGNAAVAVIVNKPEFVRYDNFQPRNYLLTITARETRTVERRFSQATVFIQITSPANHPPYFPNTLNPIVVSDNTPIGSVISNYIRAQDDDPGINGVLTYSISNNSNATTYFSINTQTGVLTLTLPLNSTVQSRYTFNAIATDGGGLSASLAILINIVDYRRLGPQFSEIFYVANVTELMTNLFPPITIKANLEPMRNDRVLRYELSTTVSQQIASIFSVNPSNGSFTMLKGVDYMDTPNKQGYFDVEVQASVVSYPEIPTTTVNCRIYILDTNNHAPYFVPVNQSYRKTIKDNTPPLTEMFNLNATDDDVGINAVVNYFIEGGAQDNFVIDMFNGLLTVARNPRLIPNTTYNITVIAVDRGQPSLTGTTMVYITITDSITRYPVFPFNEYTFYVVEASPIGLLVGSAKATSPDRRALINYSFLSNTWRAFNYSDVEVNANNILNWFIVDATSADIKVQGNVVYNLVRKVNVLLSARVTNPDVDVVGNISTNVPVTIFILPKGDNSDVVRLSPSTNFIYIQIYEQQPINTVIFQFNAFYYASSTPVTDFTFYNQSVDGNYFTLEKTTGILRIARDIRYLQTNPTKNITYFLLARAPPPSTAQAGALVIVNILPLAGNNPVFNESSYYFTVYSNDLTGKVIGQVYAVKPITVNAQVEYSLENPSDVFQITNNGTITLLRRLDDFNSRRLTYTLFISARLPNDAVSTVVATIQVIPVKVLLPRFTSTPYNFVTRFNSSDPIGQVLAYDPDPFNTTNITYAIVGTNPATNAFSIDPNTGVIRLTGQPGSSSNYVLNVSASYTSSTPLTSYAPVNVVVYTNSLDRPQFIGLNQDVYNVYYNDPNALILKVNGSSAVPDRSISYYLDTSRLPLELIPYFYMDRNTGELRFNGALPGTVSNNYTLILILSDGVSNTTKEITVGAYSNAPPTFSCKSNPIVISVPDYSPPNTLLTPSLGLTINTACSYDKPGTNFYYKLLGANLTSQSVDDVFVINSNTGQMSSKILLNAYLLDNTLIKVLVAKDEADATQALNRPGATANVTLNFIGRDIRSPTFNSSDPNCPGTGLELQRGVMDLSPISTPIIRVQAGDCDMPGFRNLEYSIQSSTFSYYVDSKEASDKSPTPASSLSAFGVESTTGQVYTQLEDLRPFYTGWFNVLIRAAKMSNSNLAATSNLKLYVLREFQLLRVLFNREVTLARNDSEEFTNAINKQLLPNFQMVPSLVTTYVDPNGGRNLSISSMCYFLLKLDPSSSNYYVTTNIAEVKPLINVTQLNPKFNLINLYDTCYSGSNSTTKWWSDKWFLWFILIAFSILVFVVALVLSCCVCFYWPMNLKEISKARPYVVFGDPAMSVAGSVADGDRW